MMKCMKCGKEIYAGRGGFYFHAGSDNKSCCPDDVAIPIKLEPNQWCTGQEWCDAGGKWGDFVAAHKVAKTAEYLLPSTSWNKINGPLQYNTNKCRYLLKLNDKAELPKEKKSVLECLQDADKIQSTDGNWNSDPYMHGMANGIKFAISVVNDKDPEYLDAPKEWLYNKVELPKSVKLQPNQWCTGQEWCDAGRSWSKFVEAHKVNQGAQFFNDKWHNSNAEFQYNTDKCKYRLKLDDKAELPKKREVPLINPQKREVPLINPLRIPIDWWGIAKDDGSDKLWFMYATQPRIGINVWDQNEGLFSLLGISPLRISTKWEGNWKNSAFTRAKIQARWEEEYGSEWCNKALEDLDAKSN